MVSRLLPLLGTVAAIYRYARDGALHVWDRARGSVHLQSVLV